VPDPDPAPKRHQTPMATALRSHATRIGSGSSLGLLQPWALHLAGYAAKHLRTVHRLYEQVHNDVPVPDHGQHPLLAILRREISRTVVLPISR